MSLLLILLLTVTVVTAYLYIYICIQWYTVKISNVFSWPICKYGHIVISESGILASPVGLKNSMDRPCSTFPDLSVLKCFSFIHLLISLHSFVSGLNCRIRQSELMNIPLISFHIILLQSTSVAVWLWRCLEHQRLCVCVRERKRERDPFLPHTDCYEYMYTAEPACGFVFIKTLWHVGCGTTSFIPLA